MAHFSPDTGIVQRLWGIVLISIILTGCAVAVKKQPETPAPMVRLSLSDYPNFMDDMNLDGLSHSLSKSLAYLKRIPATREFSFAGDRYDASHMIRSISTFKGFVETGPTTEEVAKFIRDHYRVYRSVGRSKDGRVLFTGYYEPILTGARVRTETHRYPVYAVPEDLQIVNLGDFSRRFKGEKIYGRIDGSRLVPYYDRKAIGQGEILEKRARSLAWLSDPVDLFFLQVQGSGKIYLESGMPLNVHYHATNGHPYRSIGKYLIDKGAIDRSKMSMQAIRGYLREHPDVVDEVLNYNPSYVFFKKEKEGPLGYLEVKLTPGRSIATDRRIFPAAALVYLQTKKPLVDAEGRIHTWTALNRFALNQDTGGAIRGPGRADLFWGNGPYAELAAGHMQHNGTLFFLILKPDSDIGFAAANAPPKQSPSCLLFAS